MEGLYDNTRPFACVFYRIDAADIKVVIIEMVKAAEGLFFRHTIT